MQKCAAAALLPPFCRNPPYSALKILQLLLCKVQVICQPLPGVDLVDRQARLAIRQRSEEEEAPKSSRQNHRSRDPAPNQTLSGNALAHRLGTGPAMALGRRCSRTRRVRVHGLNVEDEFDERAGD